MKNLNRCDFTGNVTKEPDIHTFGDGKKVASFSIAVNDDYKNASGELIKQVEYPNFKAYASLANIIESYVKKGDKLRVSGKFKTSSWEDKEGNKRYSTEFILNDLEMLGGTRDNSSQVEPKQAAPNDDFIDPETNLPF